MEVFVRHDAELDALGYFQYLHERDPDAAVRFLAAIDRTVEGLARQPLKAVCAVFRAATCATSAPGAWMTLKRI